MGHSLRYRISISLRRFPLVHSPVHWLLHTALKKVVDIGLEVIRLFSATAPRLGPAKGLFSLQDLVQGSQVEGRIVLADQGAPKLPEKSLMVLCRLNQHGVQPWPVLWSRHQQARLVGASLALMNERKQLATESVYYRFRCHDPAWRTIFLPQAKRLAGSWTSVISQWNPITGVPTFSHWIMDALPRLALLAEFPKDTGILVPKALAKYQKESLQLLGLLDRVRHTPERHLIVEDYFFSSPTTQIACYNPYGIGCLRSAFLPKADPSYSGPRRFIIQRKGHGRGIQNEPEINDYFRSLGWEIIDTETLTFAQEIKLFSEAEAIAGILGSGFTNTIWCQPGCAVITFVAENRLDGWVEGLCDVVQANYRYQIFPSDHAFMARVDLAEVKKLLRSAGLEAR
jgi:capsular polysaccharide biosynthesis protein